MTQEFDEAVGHGRHFGGSASRNRAHPTWAPLEWSLRVSRSRHGAPRRGSRKGNCALGNPVQIRSSSETGAARLSRLARASMGARHENHANCIQSNGLNRFVDECAIW